MITKKIMKFIFSLLLLLISIPLGIYFYNFHGGFSSNQADWSSFGSFLSGTIGTILSTCSIIALTYTLFITVRNNEESNKLTLKAIENAENQLKKMDREFSIKLFESYLETFNTAIEKKEYSIPKKGIVSKKDFIDHAYKILMIDTWSGLSNSIVENRRGFNFNRPAIIMSEMKISFDEEFRHFFYIIDTLNRTEDSETYGIMLRMYFSKLDIDILFFISCYTYTYQTQFKDIFEKNNNRLLVMSERTARAVTHAINLVNEGKTPWDDMYD